MEARFLILTPTLSALRPANFIERDQDKMESSTERTVQRRENFYCGTHHKTFI